jgi:hypothetical protein
MLGASLSVIDRATIVATMLAMFVFLCFPCFS